MTERERCPEYDSVDIMPCECGVNSMCHNCGAPIQK